MPDYSNGKIYKITSEKGCYVGCTTQSLSVRLSGHLSKMKRALNGKCYYCSSFEVMHDAKETIEIVLIEAFPCGSKRDLEAREAEVIKGIDCVNQLCSGRYWKEKTPLQQMIYDLSTEYRERRAEYNAKRLADPVFRAEHKKKARDAKRRQRADPEYRAERNRRRREARKAV